jgi:hypothetical protein
MPSITRLRHLGGGGFEATPSTHPVFVAVFVLTLLLALFVGNVLLNRDFRSAKAR